MYLEKSCPQYGPFSPVRDLFDEVQHPLLSFLPPAALCTVYEYGNEVGQSKIGVIDDVGGTNVVFDNPYLSVVI